MNHIDTSYLRRWNHIDKDERVAAIVARRDAGMKLGAIAASLGTGRTNLKAFCLRHNICGVESEYPSGGWYDMTNEARIEAIREKSVGNRTLTEIASILGVTTNTLHGFMWRQKVRGISNTRVDIRRPPPEAFVSADPIPPEVWAPLPGQEPSTGTGCQWPVDTPEGQRCCGAPKAKRSYCAHHHALAYRQPRAVDPAAVTWLANLDERGQSGSVASFKYVPPQSKKMVRRDEE